MSFLQCDLQHPLGLQTYPAAGRINVERDINDTHVLGNEILAPMNIQDVIVPLQLVSEGSMNHSIHSSYNYSRCH